MVQEASQVAQEATPVAPEQPTAEPEATPTVEAVIAEPVASIEKAAVASASGADLGDAAREASRLSLLSRNR